MTEIQPAPPPPPKHPLEQLRKILGWSRDEFAKETGLKATTIQNIERGSAPLPDDAAFAIEAATSCNAMELMESAEVWRRMRDEQPEVFAMAGASEVAATKFLPKTLNGSPFTREGYERYKQAALEPESIARAIDDLSCRLDLLLGPLGSKPEKFRRMYRYLAQLLNKERRQSGPSDAEMAEYAQRHGKAELKEMTVGELAAHEDIKHSPVWHQAKVLDRFKPEQKAHVVAESYPFWPEIERIGREEDYFVPDYVFGERCVWRITLPDAKQLVVLMNRSQATGLKGKLTDAMIKNNRQKALQADSEAPSTAGSEEPARGSIEEPAGAPIEPTKT